MTNVIIKRGEICPTCKRYYSRHSVCDSLIIEDNKVLMVLRDKDPQKGFWAIPGGYLEWDETIEQCVLREVKEETGADAEIIKLFGVYSDPERDPDDRQNVCHVFLLGLKNEKFYPQQGETKEVKWFSFDNLPKNIAFDHRKIIEDYKKSLV